MGGVWDGKRALFCGSSQGIGRACAIELARLGSAVTVVARDETALRKVVAELTGIGGGGAPAPPPHPRGDPPPLQAKVAAHLKEVGAIHILINNTGGPPHGALTEAKPEQFLQAISNHIVCNQLLVQALLAGMKSGGAGRVV